MTGLLRCPGLCVAGSFTGLRVLLLCLLPHLCWTVSYKQGDPVMLYVNKVGPYHNPQETYHYYTLPVCRPKEVHHKALSLGEVLDGDRMAESLYNIHFMENIYRQTLCTITLSEKEVDQLREAIEELYYFEFVLDDIPIWGFVGYMEESGFLPHSHKVGLWTHLDFNIEYNGDSVIFANVSVKDVKPEPLEEGGGVVGHGAAVGNAGLSITHTYSVHWYNVEEDGSCDDLDQGDNGWKIIHTDVFRFPPYRSLLCAVLGVGAQFLTLATGIIVMALLGMFNVHRHGAINSAAIVLYALTSCVSGYSSCSFYTQIQGQRWVWNIILTSSLFSGPLFFTWSVVNSVHWYSGSTQALPATTVLLLLGAWVLVGFPLTVIGGIVGKNRAGNFQAPCRTRNIPRQIPGQPCAISVELYYIFATAWGREHYTLYGILLCVFAILLSVGACISVALTYFLLSGEDYRWWWRSVLSTGSTGIFIFVYSLFYYHNRSNMSGLVQSVEFFGYSLLTALVFSLMLGTVSFWASLAFIRYIYRSLKMD
ncbi:hypothetical protein DNTS_003521 [Danionella cerebrum]|uniref:Transmembrane 9 superfamily member n=1 Tax=Danionella cerebrum TaxID=2873325 RepID=A0A553MTU2_9TELE|nr:hypothetical protein DNTS_003521 [Danionella translucida]